MEEKSGLSSSGRRFSLLTSRTLEVTTIFEEGMPRKYRGRKRESQRAKQNEVQKHAKEAGWSGTRL